MITEGKLEVRGVGLYMADTKKRIATCYMPKTTEADHIEIDKANAAHFARCWNCHADLLAACKIGLGYAQGSSGCTQPDCSVCKEKCKSIEIIKQAIALAEQS